MVIQPLFFITNMPYKIMKAASPFPALPGKTKMGKNRWHHPFSTTLTLS